MAKSKKRAPQQRPRTSTRQAQNRGRARPRKDRRLVYAALALAASAVIAVLIASSGDDGTPGGQSNAGQLLRTEAPWAPQYDGLRQRIEAARFPPVGDESYHVHALLSVFVDGEQVTVPANIGIDSRDRIESPLHTHTPDGVIHVEADDPSPFTLQDVFSIWGVDFAPDRLGAYTPAGNKDLYVYVNGEAVDAAAGYELQQGDNIVVAYGEKGSFPTEPPDDPLRGA